MKPKTASKERYIETFCRDRIVRNRRTLYVSDEVHRKIKSIAILFSDTHTTTASLVDMILSHHIETHLELFRQMEQEIMHPPSKNVSNVE